MKIGELVQGDKVALRGLLDSYGIPYVSDSEDFAVVLESIKKYVDDASNILPPDVDDLAEQVVEQVNYVIDRFKALEECDNDNDMNQIMEDIPNMLRDIITLVEDA
jgi:hypothetical protein